jgi:hypothetical protein
MSPDPKTQSLIEILERLVSLLRYHDEDDWASWLESDRARLERGEVHGIEHFLSAFGALGSANDLTLNSTNGHVLSLVDADRVTATVRELLSQAHDLAKAISPEAGLE